MGGRERPAGRAKEPAGSGAERVLILAGFVNRVGNGLFNTASALYFTLVVGLPAAQVGAALTVAGLIGLLAGAPGGRLADRCGPRTVMMLALAVQAVAMSALVLVDDGAGLTLVATADQLAAALGATGPALERWGARTRPRYARAAPEAAGEPDAARV
ncbi:MFS transporter [Streptomyces omiyaensis]|uniref:MFS transporter n=1 Tax=Streptomyces omiyaensis TaxID=68247 RepID=UPI0036F9D073